DGVARTTVDFKGLAVLADGNAGIKSPALKIIDINLLNLATHRLNHIGQKVMGQRAGSGAAFEAAVNGEGFRAGDHNGEFSLTVHLFQPDVLLLLHLADDDLVKFHLDGHVANSKLAVLLLYTSH